jgi:hypothetical protein
LTALRLVLATLVAVGLTAGLVVCSGLPYVDDSSGDALIRLSWRTVGERIEECRKPTEEELAALPPHMRRQEICEGRTTPFRLDVAIDGTAVFADRILPGGAHHDRPVYVLREFPISPGRHRLQVRFEVELPPESARAARAPLTLDETLTLEPGRIALVTYDDDAARLHVVATSREPAQQGGR